jgi:hypothetical protein
VITVFLLSVSSWSSRQSITASWWSLAYLGDGRGDIQTDRQTDRHGMNEGVEEQEKR